EFPFSDLQRKKRRPGLVLFDDGRDVLLSRLTTHSPRDASDVPLKHWSTVGLPQASTVRLAKLATVDSRLVHHIIDHLHKEDAAILSQAVQRLCTTITTELQK